MMWHWILTGNYTRKPWAIAISAWCLMLPLASYHSLSKPFFSPLVCRLSWHFFHQTIATLNHTWLTPTALITPTYLSISSKGLWKIFSPIKHSKIKSISFSSSKVTSSFQFKLIFEGLVQLLHLRSMSLIWSDGENWQKGWEVKRAYNLVEERLRENSMMEKRSSDQMWYYPPRKKKREVL